MQWMMDYMAARTLDAVQGRLAEALQGCSRVGVAFSGGVDSSLIATACVQHAEVMLLTVGFESSHDIKYATTIAERLRLPHHSHIISEQDLIRAYRLVRDFVPEGRPLSWYENCIGFYIAAGLANTLRLDQMVAANGIDELFCGYDSYRRIYDSGEGAIQEMILQKTANEVLMLDAVSEAAGLHGVLVRQPLLHDSFVQFSWTVPLSEKVRGSDDILRKHAVRRAAAMAGLPPDVCLKRKKALQYGTRIHQGLLRVIQNL